MIRTAIQGIIFNPRESMKLDIHKNSFLLIDENGFIVDIVDHIDAVYVHEFIDRRDHLILPGLIDCHSHYPQYSFAGIGTGTLLDWLNNYTFPTEESYSDENLAREHSEIFFKSLISNGTSCAVIYPTSNFKVCDIAFNTAEEFGLRIIMGQVLMDQNSRPGLLLEKEQAIKESEALINKWHGFDEGRLQYAISPRFALACSMDLMTAAADLARKYDCFVQTHLSENKDEIEKVRKLFPSCKSYTDVYNKAGLLTNKTLLGHCIHLEASELDLILKNKSRLIHCPSSNRYLASGIFPFKRYLDSGAEIALGSDVAGGYSLNMLNEAKEAIETSKQLFMSTEKYQDIISLEEAIYHITLGAARAISQDHLIGSFDKGKEADFIVLNDQPVNPYKKVNFFQNPIERLRRSIYNATNAIIDSTYVRGKKLNGNL